MVANDINKDSNKQIKGNLNILVSVAQPCNYAYACAHIYIYLPTFHHTKLYCLFFFPTHNIVHEANSAHDNTQPKSQIKAR